MKILQSFTHLHIRLLHNTGDYILKSAGNQTALASSELHCMYAKNTDTISQNIFWVFCPFTKYTIYKPSMENVLLQAYGVNPAGVN